MTKKTEINKYKTATLLLSLLLVGGLFYIVDLSQQIKTERNNTFKLISEKDKLLSDLNEQKKAYDKAIAENTSFINDLVAEREKLIQLIGDVKKFNGTEVELLKFKQKYNSLEANKKIILAKVNELSIKNNLLTSKKDSTDNVLNLERNTNTLLKEKINTLDKKIESGSKIAIVNLNASAIYAKNADKQIITNKASDANIIIISFTIPENKIAVPQELNYYVQIIDPENNIIGENSSKVFENKKTLSYSFLKTIDYKNTSVEIKEQLYSTKYSKGNYVINVFENSQLVKSTVFVLN